MSETEHVKGKLIPFITGTDLESACKLFADKLGKYDLYGYDTYQEWLSDEYYREYFLKGNTVYEIVSEDVENSDHILIANKQDDGVILFELRYHNGGCSFDEALSSATENMNE